MESVLTAIEDDPAVLDDQDGVANGGNVFEGVGTEGEKKLLHVRGCKLMPKLLAVLDRGAVADFRDRRIASRCERNEPLQFNYNWDNRDLLVGERFANRGWAKEAFARFLAFGDDPSGHRPAVPASPISGDTRRNACRQGVQTALAAVPAMATGLLSLYRHEP